MGKNRFSEELAARLAGLPGLQGWVPKQSRFKRLTDPLGGRPKGVARLALEPGRFRAGKALASALRPEVERELKRAVDPQGS